LPDYQRENPKSQRSLAELAAVHGRPEETARTVVSGGGEAPIENRVAHVPEIIDPTMEQQEKPASAG